MDSEFRRLLDESKKTTTIERYDASMELTAAHILFIPDRLMEILENFFEFPCIKLYVDDLKGVKNISSNELSSQNSRDFDFIFKLAKIIHEDMSRLKPNKDGIKNIIKNPSEILARINLVDKTLSQYMKSYPNQDLMNEVVNALILLCFAQISLENKDYMSMFSYRDMYSETIMGMKLKKEANSSDTVSEAISLRNKQKSIIANEARWQGHVEKRRRSYLELDKRRQAELGKKLSIKYSATWIYEHHNESNLQYETIREHLSKARKGIFTND